MGRRNVKLLQLKDAVCYREFRVDGKSHVFKLGRILTCNWRSNDNSRHALVSVPQVKPADRNPNKLCAVYVQPCHRGETVFSSYICECNATMDRSGKKITHNSFYVYNGQQWVKVEDRNAKTRLDAHWKQKFLAGH